MVLPMTAVLLPAAAAPYVTGEVHAVKESFAPSGTREQENLAARSAEANWKDGLVLLVGLWGLLWIAGSGSWPVNGTFQTRPCCDGRPSTLGSSPTYRLPCGSSVNESTTSYGPRLPSRNAPWDEKKSTLPVLAENSDTLVLFVPGAGQVGGQPIGMDGPAI